jgi:hypothetical protein
MSKIEVDAITQQSGTTLTVGGGACKTATVDATTVTLGRSGGTVSLASGATQSGFGRTGTVDWDTTAKTASFTAVSGNGYFVNTTSGAITVTLPAGSAGDIVAISDYASTFQTNNVTITPNGTNKINGVNDSAYLTTQGIAVSLVYVDDTRGWKSVTGSDNDTTGEIPAFVAATGGTVSTVDTNFKVHIFTGPGTFTVTCSGNISGSNSIDYLVVAGGGGGGSSPSGNDSAGGGGAGGFRESQDASFAPVYTASPLKTTTSLNLPATAYPITVGGGGSAGSSSRGGNGNASTLSTITSTGGGGGGTYATSPNAGNDGGSGGGGSGGNPGSIPVTAGGSGNTPPVSPPQGKDGGPGSTPGVYNTNIVGGGGGGALNSPQTAQAGCATSVAKGGDGAGTAITPSPSYGTPGTTAGLRYFAGGGGVGNVPARPGGYQGCSAGGDGGGGSTGNSGTTNTGGGGSSGSDGPGNTGGSGIVIIRYKFQ